MEPDPSHATHTHLSIWLADYDSGQEGYSHAGITGAEDIIEKGFGFWDRTSPSDTLYFQEAKLLALSNIERTRETVGVDTMRPPFGLKL